MRQNKIWIASFLIAAGMVPGLAAEVNRIVMRVNEEIATLYDYERLRAERINSIMRSEIPEERRQEMMARLGELILQDMLEEMLVVSRAGQLGITPSEAAVDDGVRATMESFGIGTEEEFVQALQENNMSLGEFRKEVKKNLVVREVMGREVNSRIVLEEEDLRRFYQSHQEDFQVAKRVRLREIVVLDSSGLPEEERQRIADELMTQLTGESADTVVAEHESAGRTSGWIEHGWIGTGDLDPQLQPAVDALTSGEVSPPTRGRGGLHLLQALEVEEASVSSFQEVRESIEEMERQRLFTVELRSYRDELVASSYIVVNPPAEAAGFRPLAGSGRPAGDDTGLVIDGLATGATQPEVSSDGSSIDGGF